MTREWTTVDKTRWRRGEWRQEPDKVQWVDPTTDLDCLLHRNPVGVWCGYVGVPDGHPYFGVPYGRCDVDVHGGLTYSAFCQDTDDESHGICHLPEEGRPPRVWWLGFDCAHLGDLIPHRGGEQPSIGGWGSCLEPVSRKDVYRNREYVAAEVTRLAAQLA